LNKRITRHSRGERSAAAEKSAAIKKTIAGNRCQFFPYSLGSTAWFRFHSRPPAPPSDQKG
jgi:hypothetical protein